MLVDINLLPQPKQRNSSIYLLVGFILISFLLAGLAGFFWYSGQKQIEESLEKQAAQIQELRQIREQQNKPVEETVTPTKNYEAAVQWLNEYPLSTVILLNEISNLLTDRGFVIQFNYSNSDQIHLVAQFDASREVAFFLERLKASSFFSEVTLNQIDTVQITGDSTDVLPRYQADFQLTIEASEVRKAEKEMDQP